MDLNLTVSGLTFDHIWSDKTAGSLRRDTSRGASLPTELTIRHQDYVDSATKVAGKRTVVRFDYYMTMTDGIIRPVSFYLVGAGPTDPLVTASVTDSISAMLVNLVHGTTNTAGLDLKSAIFASRQQ
nr:MAG: coat protein [Leviviridae sp.]